MHYRITNALLAALLLSSLLLGLAGCGGGGAGSQASPADAPSATESAPKGATIDLTSLKLMPLDTDHARWEYNITDATGRYLYTGVRELQKPAAGANYTVSLTEVENYAADISHLLLRDDGIYADYGSGAAGLPWSAGQQIGLVREFAYASYAIGEPRVVTRQGAWDEDLDGDGKHEAFRFEFTQVYRGMAPLTVPLMSADAARFTNTYRIAITGSKAGDIDGFVLREEIYLVPGFGPLKMVRQEETLGGTVVDGPKTWTIARMENVGPQAPTSVPPQVTAPVAPTPDGTPSAPVTAALQQFDLPGNDLVYDAARNRYYASLPSSAGAHGNAIAVIDAGTAAVTYSAAVGSEPGQLAVSPDGKYLYAGLQGEGEVVKLALPSLDVAARISLGSSPTYGSFFAQSIAVSPADSEVFAVSLYSKGVSPRHRGVALYTGSAFAAKRTQNHTGSNLIAFNEDGTALFGYNNETTEFGLRRIAVAPDGLTEVKVLPADRGFGGTKIAVRNGLVYLKGAVFDTADLTQKGQYMNVGGLCKPLATGARTACLPPYLWSDGKALSIYDTVAMTKVSSLQLPAPLSEDPSALSSMAAGPAGQVAISYRSSTIGVPSALYLLTDNSLK